MTKPDAVEAHLCEDGKTVLIEAFAGDESLGMWSFSLSEKASAFDDRKLATRALTFMRKAFGPAMHEQMAAWARRQ